MEKIKPKVGMYLVDKQYKNTIYKIVQFGDQPDWIFKVDIIEGADTYGSGTWFDTQEINEHFIEVEYNVATRTLYGKR